MTDKPDLTRRKLLAGAPLAGAAIALGPTGAEAAVRTVPVDPLQPTFETTDRIATYYRLARD